MLFPFPLYIDVEEERLKFSFDSSCMSMSAMESTVRFLMSPVFLEHVLHQLRTHDDCDDLHLNTMGVDVTILGGFVDVTFPIRAPESARDATIRSRLSGDVLRLPHPLLTL